MVYGTPFDPATPTDADLASAGDDRIREIKAALIERLGTVFTNFPDGDPLEIKAAIISKSGVVTQGTLAVRPNPPTASGQLYYATDENELYISSKDDPPVWVKVVSAQLAQSVERLFNLVSGTSNIGSIDIVASVVHVAGQSMTDASGNIVVSLATWDFSASKILAVIPGSVIGRIIDYAFHNASANEVSFHVVNNMETSAVNYQAVYRFTILVGA